MSDPAPSAPRDPKDDAERIRLKRLAKLGGASASASGQSTPATAATSSPNATPTSPSPSSSVSSPPAPKPTPKPAPRSQLVSPASSASSPAPVVKKKPVAPAKLDFPSWEHEILQNVLKVTLKKDVADKSGQDLVWLKSLAEELGSDGGLPDRLSLDILDPLLISRLELDPQGMTDDLEYLPVVASLPENQTVFEYLVGCWKRLNAARSALVKRNYPPVDMQNALGKLEKIRELIISYAGLTLQEPEMFPQPQSRSDIGPPELIKPLLSLSSFSAPLLSSPTINPNTLSPAEIEPFLQDLARRFEPDNEIDAVLEPVIRGLLFHESLFRVEGLAGGDAGWRGVIGGLELLVSIKSIACMITRMPDWIPKDAAPQAFENVSLFGPLCRLGLFSREWPAISTTYFTEPVKRSRDDIESSFASLRSTMKSLQSSLFQIFNAMVRASPDSREAVLQYFAHVITLNSKRAGMQVDPDTVSSDSFMLNLQAVLLRFAEPFMDANYSKLDRIDPLFYAHSDRIVLGDETRIKATTEEANQFMEENKQTTGPPNFISHIFFLTVAMSHYGFLKTIDTYSNTHKQMDDIQRHLQMLEGDGSWMGSPMQARVEAAIKLVKTEEAKIRMQQLAFQAGLLDPELVFRCLSFTNFLSTWLIRQADPKQKHPSPSVSLPLPKEVPMVFRTLPEYLVEDVVDYMYFAVQNAPEKFELAGKNELLVFILTFLTSTWYIKNPFLKSKINDALFMGTWGYGRERNGVLGNLLNTHPMALKHLMSALTHFYIEVEQTGASSQFYDKFNARRNIAFVLKIIWNNPTHREALSVEAKNVDKFIRFINLMINDVTYLMDESLGELAQIHNIQQEMDDQVTWNSQSAEHRREREGTLRSLERHASGYTTLGRSTVELLKVFTAETKQPFMMPEIVDRLAAMLDYNLAALAGPKCQDLVVREPEKLKFNPKALLSDILQVYLNLSDQQTFVEAVAGDGRSYSKELFERAADIAVRRAIRGESDIQIFRAFIVKVEDARAVMEAEEDLGEVPDEFLDPLMFTVMKDPVRLPSSNAIVDRATIKSHLLSDTKDPFNRAPLSIEDVVPEPELKAKINTFLVERRLKSKASNAMDVDSQ
ncbi:ubiquitin conjugation factor E4 [Coprinopsis marcescibilis]|uniref:RING-type E3 ubiquitin transferase n=1 Tax=Coprinopsis marcescibilis TaxID=230819 RepID=A0A5C3L675_COPMA|nr:ubiquitin conjugation factor E4 [Coprinopsis marcescibilis]